MTKIKPHILHLQSSFAPGGKELRTVQLINAFGASFEHTIVSAEPEALGAAERLNRGPKVTLQPDFPSLKGRPWPGRLQNIARVMQGYDLICTYNWGAMDAVMAHTVFCDALKLPPLIHHEDGFDEQELVRRKRRRNWFRKIALGKASALVVPSATLEKIALAEWAQPAGRVRRIANGIDTKRFAKKPRPNAVPSLRKRPDDLWVGTLAGLRKVKNLTRMVRDFAVLPDSWQLVIVGEGPERDRILGDAEQLGIADRVHLPGAVPDPAKVVGLFDIFALSSDTEQFPISAVEAMAAGLPVAAPDVGDITAMLAEQNAHFLSLFHQHDDLAGAIGGLACDTALRSLLGKANQNKAREQFDEKEMIAAYKQLYTSVIEQGS